MRPLELTTKTGDWQPRVRSAQRTTRNGRKEIFCGEMERQKAKKGAFPQAPFVPFGKIP